MKPVLSSYLTRQKSVRQLPGLPVSPALGLAVMIPCYNEPALLKCLRSLARADQPMCDVEIAILVNAPENAAPEAVAQNKQTLKELEAFSKETGSSHFRIYYWQVTLPVSQYAGVGLARKIGMDEIVHRFASIDRPEGVILSLDADCEVSSGYFTEIEKQLYLNKRAVAAIPAFEHPLQPLDERSALRKAMIQYELYLRYYKHALQYTGFPYPYYTIGSDFAVKAETYCRAGGMGKYQGGEDFYFLQKIFPLGNTIEIRTAKVYPAARLSDRVPFGTGPSLIKLTSGATETKYTYAWHSFGWLRAFISRRERWFKQPANRIKEDWKEIQVAGRNSTFPESLQVYLEEIRLAEMIEELGRNCASPPIFCRRFFESFNALRILQSLNALQQTYPLQPVAQETAKLLKEMYHISVAEPDAESLLRRMQEYY